MYITFVSVLHKSRIVGLDGIWFKLYFATEFSKLKYLYIVFSGQIIVSANYNTVFADQRNFFSVLEINTLFVHCDTHFRT